MYADNALSYQFLRQNLEVDIIPNVQVWKFEAGDISFLVWSHPASNGRADLDSKPGSAHFISGPCYVTM